MILMKNSGLGCPIVKERGMVLVGNILIKIADAFIFAKKLLE